MHPVVRVTLFKKMHLPTLGLTKRKFYICVAQEKKLFSLCWYFVTHI
jgi:hypothetical protein